MNDSNIGPVILSWNIQNGVDAYIKPKQREQIDYLRESGADIFALQEVDDRYFSQLQANLPDYHWQLVPALNYVENGQPRSFGNAIASRLPVIQWRNHCLLPAPSEAYQHMPRSAGEIVVQTPQGPLRVITTHLEFFCREQRLSQLAQIEQIIDAAKVLNESPSQARDGLYRPLALPEACILCGDLNIPDNSAEYREQLAKRRQWLDLAADNPQATCGVFDHQQWPNGADRRDYFLSHGDELAGSVSVDLDCDLSDHQPLFLTLSCN